MTLTCTPVKFGVWHVPVRNSGGGTSIALSLVNDTPSVTSNTAGVALSSTPGHEAARGRCELVGSSATDGTSASISVTGSAYGTLSGDAASAYGGLSSPSVAAGLDFDLDMSPTASITGGGSVFYVGGGLFIPQIIQASNYGAYKNNASLSINVDDHQ